MGAAVTGAHQLAQSSGRAFGGALLFSLPLLMTMEVWQLGLTIPRYRLALLMVGTVLLVVFLSQHFGAGSPGVGWRGSLADAGVAFAMAAVAAALVLGVLSVVEPLRGWRDGLSVIAIEMLPAAIGASFARSQLGVGGRRVPTTTYGGELLLMAAGAIVFAANIAPTEEVVLLAAEVGPWHPVALVVLCLVFMHGFVYWVGFRGQEAAVGGVLRSFLTLTVVGYVIALLLSAYLLWTFGRFDDVGLLMAVTESVVLALPASLGAAAARLIL
ncbi:TIGR02587 family membrane protein [Modestobacter italicus]|uniref:TIGR02587 family membrane protein n=1 Tax=Modestobacter italicus (strain DSM 44449 / CECT 9708 / BC 501) TaxID=2732864 RepID=UPI001C96F3C8|nr:TIGR02587 family membrane protein [Modestobacter italicus]